MKIRIATGFPHKFSENVMNHQIQYYVYASKINFRPSHEKIFEQIIHWHSSKARSSPTINTIILRVFMFKDGKFLQYIEGQKA